MRYPFVCNVIIHRVSIIRHELDPALVEWVMVQADSMGVRGCVLDL